MITVFIQRRMTAQQRTLRKQPLRMVYSWIYPACFWIENSSRNRFSLNGIPDLPTLGFSAQKTYKIKNPIKKVFLKLIKLTQNIRNRLNRKKIHISHFYDFNFSGYGNFSEVLILILNASSRPLLYSSGWCHLRGPIQGPPSAIVL